MLRQQVVVLPEKERGFHLVTDEIVAQLSDVRAIQDVKVGLLHLLLQHTSASLTLNENYDESVRSDMERHIDAQAPEKKGLYEHDLEGPDDMPAHIKSSLLGVSLTIPIRDGALALGRWQGIWLGEHRNRGGQRRIMATIQL